MSSVTYCPEDNKLRLYVGRVPRDEYERLRAAGFTSTPKQECDFVATWTPSREDLAREYLEDDEDIGDEDYSPEDRAADRAERFGGYRDKRAAEAGASADAFEAGPSAFGHQNRARAERQAARHDRKRVYAVSQWSKAEYWQERTAAVIGHALHKSSPEVRRGRILTLEAELRALEASYTPADDPPQIINQRAYNYATGEYRHGGAAVPHVWVGPKGRGGRWAEVASLDAIKAAAERWRNHYELRLTYERMMLENEGGTAAAVEMELGGWVNASLHGRGHRFGGGWVQIHKINRSPATGRVVSIGTEKGGFMKVERLPADAYRAPTEDERAAFAQAKKAAKKAKPVVSLINPTDEDAEKLQALLNQQAADYARSKGREPSEPREVKRITQAEYSRFSGPDGAYQVKEFRFGGVAFKCRKKHAGFYDYSAAESVIVLTDKPQKPFPAGWDAVAVEAEATTEAVNV